MLVVIVLAFNMPASAQIGAGIGAGIASTSSFSAAAGGIGIGGFGGFGFPFNWGIGSLGIGGFPFNWGLGAGFGSFGLGWNKFSPGFGLGSFFSPGFLSTWQYLPFITGQELVPPLGPGFGVTPWAFGLGATVRSLPLFFGAHGFGFPFTLGGFGASLAPGIC
jgi:hypothetical protein